ncbi:MAG TPA: hypothetical protein VM695_00255, partial [Phycisphaerae bacterium]|nr:hypothetical protein [Phycisphaerae bacterium]
EGAYSTGAVIVIVVVVWLLGRLWRQRCPAEAAEVGGFLPAYVLMAIVLTGLVMTGGMGLMGALILLGAVVCPVELIHRLLARRAART